MHEGVNEGERNSTIASLTGHLLWHGVDPQVALELMLAWNRLRCCPPLDDEEVARVVASITRLHEAKSPLPRLAKPPARLGRQQGSVLLFFCNMST